MLKEHEAAKWLTAERLESVEWLPADKGLVEGIREKCEVIYYEPIFRARLEIIPQ